MSAYNYPLQSPSSGLVHGREMADCGICGAKTLLYVAGVPLCIECDRRMSEEQARFLSHREDCDHTVFPN